MTLLVWVSIFPLSSLSPRALSRSERSPSEETPDTAATLFSQPWIHCGGLCSVVVLRASTSALVHCGDSFFLTKTKEFLVEADLGQRQNRPVITDSDGKAALDVAPDNIPLIASSRFCQPEGGTAWVETLLEMHLAFSAFRQYDLHRRLSLRFQ